ncbi:MAG: hypothetical protein ACJATF_000484 [Flavobacteriales bacterium]
MILDFDISSKNDFGRDHYILTNVTICSNFAIRHDVGKMPDFSPRSDGTAFVDDSRFVSEVFFRGQD